MLPHKEKDTMDDIRKQDVMDGFFSAPLADSDPELAAAIGMSWSASRTRSR